MPENFGIPCRAALLALLVLGSCGLAGRLPAGAEFSPAGNPVVVLEVGHQTVRAEVVSTPERLFLGLGGRTELPWGQGMLFLLPQAGIQQFCMRGMLIPIDIIWIYRQRIIGFALDLQPGDPGVFTSPGPADQVLEVPAGYVRTNGLRIGDPVRLRPAQ